jgi:peptidoglycan hydrolase-like protein with peptidoglycan-binding domain
MEPNRSRRAAAIENRARPCARPALERLGRWAVSLLALAVIAVPAAAQAGSSGGIGGSSGGSGGTGGGGADESAGAGNRAGCLAKQFGRRTLREGDCGKDVATLNWILKSKDYAAPLAQDFDAGTDGAVRSFQRDADLGVDGVVDEATSAALVNAMPTQRATWYGPGFFGNTTACGERLTRRTKGVAHKTLPCGSKVVLRYKGRFVRTRVIDRGPYANGAKWDLTQATARQLRFTYTDDVRVAKIAKAAK